MQVVESFVWLFHLIEIKNALCRLIKNTTDENDDPLCFLMFV